MTKSSEKEITIYLEGKEVSAPVSNVEMTPYFVCFIDLLGTTDNIKTHRDKNYVSQLHAIMDLCRKINDLQQRQLKIKTFSDNICFLLPIPEDMQKAKLDFHTFLTVVATFQILLLKYTGELVRGGIAAGDAFCDDALVWGEALVEAYSLESSKGTNYPAVFLADDLVQYFPDNYNCLGLAIHDARFKNRFLNFFVELDNEPSKPLLKDVFDKLSQKLQASIFSDPTRGDVFQKLIWTCSYYNAVAVKLERPDLVFDITWNQAGGIKIPIVPHAEFQKSKTPKTAERKD